MSNIDKRALRNLATSLDGDDWHAEGNSVYGGAYDVGDNVCYDHIASCESVNGESPHADFIAAANPATVLALLDELEAAEKSNEFLKEQLAQLANFNPDWDKLEAATESLREHMAKLSAAEKRIAELSALQGKPIAWESTTPVYVKFITDERYQRLRPGYKKWYKPYRCSQCAAAGKGE
ncbi:ead/Ea22-like family protein [Enterobacter kobei]